MSKIRLLSEHLANQIAAGEVVERPASVIKELVENSIDAGASRVQVQVKGYGTSLLQVIDNGEGMVQDDVLLSLERHATSKLQEESQLTNINTLGFRGEALPSIASVSRMTILSRQRGKQVGTRAVINYGKIQKIHEDGCSHGTIIEVKNLFGNVPARKKFLKSGRTELFHIEETLKNLSLAHTDTAFSLTVENRQVFDLNPSDLETRVKAISHYQGKLLPIKSSKTSDNEPRVSGYLFLPDKSISSKNNRLRILVNGRPVQNNIARYAASEGLQGFLMKGQQPSGVLLITVPPDQVDVNVHPAKREVRFHSPNVVHHLIRQAVADALRHHQEQVRGTIFSSKIEYVAEQTYPEYIRTSSQNQCENTIERGSTQTLPQEEKTYSLKDKETAATIKTSEPELKMPEQTSINQAPATFMTHFVSEETIDFKGMTLIGQAMNLYLLCEKNEQLIVIDQHAAHERILYEKLKQGYLTKKMAGQSLLFPVTVELSPRQLDIIERHLKELEELGLTVEPFGDATWVIKSIPALIKNIAPIEILQEILQSFQSGVKRKIAGIVPESIDNTLASMACKSAIKSGKSMAPVEIIALLCQMEESDLFSHCPHGRPVMKLFTKRDIEKWFRRA